MGNKQYRKEVFSCQRNTLTIRGYLLKPELEGKLPAVIVSHGFGANTSIIKSYAKRFAEMGYVTVYFDFCGSGRSKSDGASTDMSVLTEKEDLSAVLDCVRALDYVDSGNIVLAGCSQGGLVSALLAAEREADVSKLVLYYPAFCIPDDARRGRLPGRTFDPAHVPEAFFVFAVKLGPRYVLDAQKLDPFKEISAYARPVLIVHGTADRIVNVSYAARAAKVYPNARLVIIDRGDHGFVFRGFKAAMNATADFLLKASL